MSATTMSVMPRYTDVMLKVMEIDAKLKSNNDVTRKIIMLRSQLAAAVGNSNPSTTELMNAPMTLEAKDAVMHAMCIIPVPLCAIYLGIPAGVLYEFKRKVGDAFGANYCQSLCFSINELQIFAKNRDWFGESSGNSGLLDHSTPPIWFLLQGTFVSWDVMLGYLAVNNCASYAGIHQNGSVRRPLRLSDIRREFTARFPSPTRPPLMLAVSEWGIENNIIVGAKGATH